MSRPCFRGTSIFVYIASFSSLEVLCFFAYHLSLFLSLCVFVCIVSVYLYVYVTYIHLHGVYVRH